MGRTSGCPPATPTLPPNQGRIPTTDRPPLPGYGSDGAEDHGCGEQVRGTSRMRLRVSTQSAADCPTHDFGRCSALDGALVVQLVCQPKVPHGAAPPCLGTRSFHLVAKLQPVAPDATIGLKIAGADSPSAPAGSLFGRRILQRGVTLFLAVLPWDGYLIRGAGSFRPG